MTTAVAQPRVLVVEDEPEIALALRTILSTEGYQVRTADEKEAVSADCGDWRAQIVLACLTPGGAHLDVCRRIRSSSSVPIIVLSADSNEGFKVEALDSGADDYVVRPIGARELLARVRAALRRGGGAVVHAPDRFEAGAFRVDLDQRRVSVGAAEVRLTPKEFDLFVYMARRPNRVIPHRTLLQAVWGDDSQGHSEYLRVFMRQLRQKLEDDPSEPRHLVTEPWVGYLFSPDGRSPAASSC